MTLPAVPTQREALAASKRASEPAIRAAIAYLAATPRERHTHDIAHAIGFAGRLQTLGKLLQRHPEAVVSRSNGRYTYWRHRDWARASNDTTEARA